LEQADTTKAKKIARQKLFDVLIVFIACLTRQATLSLFLLQKRHVFHEEFVISHRRRVDSRKQTAGKSLRQQKVSAKEISTLEKARLVC